jgi:outer membrane receptor for ferrienterochelin and colicin
LLPQESDNIDIGLNQKIILKNNIYGELSIVLYSMYIENEIDFDISTFKYGNISESTHRGIETSFGLFLSDLVNLRHSSNFTEVKFGSGDYKNKMLKNIPELSYTNRITIKISEQLSLLFGQKYFGLVYINDENTESLPAYSIFDTNLKFTRSNYGIDVSIFNIGDKLYNGSAYMLFDQMIQQNVKFFYPAQKRNFQLRLSFNL